MFIIKKRETEIKKSDITAYYKAIERILLDGEKEAKFSRILGINEPRRKKLVKKLSYNGWYLDDWTEVDGKMIKFLQNNIEAGLLSKVDDYLIKYYEQKIEDIQARLIKNYQKRQNLLNEAFAAIRDEKYSSSILILLTQSDGVCHDITQSFYFINLNKSKNFVPQAEPHIKNNLSSHLHFLLEPITNKTAINAHKSEIALFDSPLNRHEVIHGLNSDFGTKENALKMISFISYLDNIFSELYHYSI